MQDLGLIKALRELLPGLELHASTQMTCHNSAGAEFLQGLGNYATSPENYADLLLHLSGGQSTEDFSIAPKPPSGHKGRNTMAY